MFNALINEDYSNSVDIDRYKSVLEHTLSIVDFSVGTGIYMLLTNLNLSLGKTAGCNNKFLIISTDMSQIEIETKIKLTIANLDQLRIRQKFVR